MLVCNVSQRARRASIAAELAEAAAAVDATTTGNVVFATLVDDPASVGETVDAFLGEIMLEAASAADTVDLTFVYAAAVDETSTATDTAGATFISEVAVDETATGADAPDATITAATVIIVTGTPVTTGIEYEHGVGSTYAGFTVSASGGTAPYTYSIAAGTLPAGITLNSGTGAVSGTPAFESAGTYAGIVIRATDAASYTGDLAAFTLTISYKDPYYSSTKLLIDHDAADGSTTFTDASAANRGNASPQGNAQHDTGVTPPYGTSWYLFDGSGDSFRFPDSNDWNLGTQSFTLDAVIRPTDVTGTRFWIGQWQTAPNLNFVAYQFNAEIWLNVSTTGSNTISDLGATGTQLVVNTTYHFRLDFDGIKYRLYKNGTMVASSTTLRSIFTGSNQNLAIGANSLNSSFFYVGHMKGIRITVGVARTASDSGYTISNRALPTS